MNLIKAFTIVSAICFLTISTARATSPHYAMVTATGTGDGSSWANAATLTQAITNAAAGDDIWTKSGTYGQIYRSYRSTVTTR